MSDCKYFGIGPVPAEFQDEHCAFCSDEMSNACFNELRYNEAKALPCFGQAGELNACETCMYYDVCIDEKGDAL